MMKFLANENFPFPSIKILRKNAIDVYSIAENNPGIDDKEVIEIALEKSLTILTFDRDYGELIFKYAISTPPAVIYFRNKGQEPEFAANILINILSENTIQIDACFTVVDHDNIRQRKYL
jgi:predicted nuclease of predicted toxin-antitoxin system